MKPILAAALIFLAVRADAATAFKVKRGDLVVRVKVTGTVIPDDIFRIKSTIDGRVESLLASTFTWRGVDQPLSFLAHKELAAMLDSKGAQNVDILEDRWQRVYRPTAVRCPDTCFVLKNFLKVKSWVKPDAVLFEAAKTLKLVGRVRPEDVYWVKDGQEFTFWAVKDPKRVLKGRVTRLLLDIQGEKVTPGASFTLIMSKDRYFDPGTEWEGLIIPLKKNGVLTVPTEALVRGKDGSIYLPVRVSTGITTQGLTEVTAGTEENREALLLDDSQLSAAERHKVEIDQEALRLRLLAQQKEAEKAAGAAAKSAGKPAPDFSPALEAPPPPVKKPKHAPVMDTTDYGEDPYAEPQ